MSETKVNEKNQKNLDALIGRRVKYLCPKGGFERYGIIIKTNRRMRDDAPKVTKSGRRIKKPTKGCVIIEMPNGTIQPVPEASVLCWIYYGVERPLDWRPAAKECAQDGTGTGTETEKSLGRDAVPC